MDFLFFHVDRGVLGMLLVGLHVLFYMGTYTWFQRDLPEDTKNQSNTKVTLFILSNLWPLTWVAWSVYAVCYKISSVQRHRRIQKLVDKNNELVDEVARLDKELKAQKEVNKKLEEEIHQTSHQISVHQLEEQDRRQREEELAKKRHPNSSKRPHPREKLPPYSPDVWKAINMLNERVTRIEDQEAKKDDPEEDSSGQ